MKRILKQILHGFSKKVYKVGDVADRFVEPAPIPIDFWARGVVPVIKKRERPLSTETTGGHPSRRSNAADNPSPLTRIVPKKGKLNASTKAALNALIHTSLAANTESLTPASSKQSRRMSRQKPEKKSLPSNPTSQDNTTTVSSIDLAIEEEARKLEKLKQELKGKEYTFDSNGEIIPLVKYEPEKEHKYGVVDWKLTA